MSLSVFNSSMLLRTRWIRDVSLVSPNIEKFDIRDTTLSYRARAKQILLMIRGYGRTTTRRSFDDRMLAIDLDRLLTSIGAGLIRP